MTNTSDRRRFLQRTLLAGAALGAGSEELARNASAAPSVDADANPNIRPGLVNWHRDLAAACAASRTSGKPVLHFQMMGRLDQRFC